MAYALGMTQIREFTTQAARYRPFKANDPLCLVNASVGLYPQILENRVQTPVIFEVADQPLLLPACAALAAVE